MPPHLTTVVFHLKHIIHEANADGLQRTQEGLLRFALSLGDGASLSLLFGSAPGNGGAVAVYLVFRVPNVRREDSKKGAVGVRESIERWLASNVTFAAFEPVAYDEIWREFSEPGEVLEGIELRRSLITLDVATWTPLAASALGFVRESKGSKNRNRRALQYVSPAIHNQEGPRKVCASLAAQGAPCIFEATFQAAPAPTVLFERFEDSIHQCEKLLQGDAGETVPASSSLTIITSRARLLRDWLSRQRDLLMSPGNTVSGRFRLFSKERLPQDLASAAMEYFSSAPLVSDEGLLAGAVERFPAAVGDPAASCGALSPDEMSAVWATFDLGQASRLLNLPHALAGTRFPGLDTRSFRPLDVPHSIPEDGILIGHAHRAARKVEVRLSSAEHRQHVYIVGATGTGKTTLMRNMMMGHIAAGHGIAVIDPHGDLIDSILERLPERRLNDVVLFDPSDADYPIGFNPLEWKTEEERAFLLDEMLNILLLVWEGTGSGEAFGPMFFHNIRFGLMLLMCDPNLPGTLVDFPSLFMQKSFHKRWLPKLKDPLGRRFWLHEFPEAEYNKENFIQYIVSKLDPLLTNPLLRNIIGQRRSNLHLDEIINNDGILLVDLSKGKMGELSSRMLGCFLIAKIYTAAMRRVRVGKSERRDFHLYVDEFQNLATSTFAQMLSEARKFRLSVNICNQYVSQLSPATSAGIFGNVGTVAAFRTGHSDAEVLGKYYAPYVDPAALSDQPNRHAFIRLMNGDMRMPPFSMYVETTPLAPKNLKEKVLERSRKLAVARQDVEKSIELGLLAPVPMEDAR